MQEQAQPIDPSEQRPPVDPARMARDPNTPLSVLRALAQEFPQEVATNPSLRLVLSLDPSAFLQGNRSPRTSKGPGVQEVLADFMRHEAVHGAIADAFIGLRHPLLLHALMGNEHLTHDQHQRIANHLETGGKTGRFALHAHRHLHPRPEGVPVEPYVPFVTSLVKQSHPLADDYTIARYLPDEEIARYWADRVMNGDSVYTLKRLPPTTQAAISERIADRASQTVDETALRYSAEALIDLPHASSRALEGLADRFAREHATTTFLSRILPHPNAPLARLRERVLPLSRKHPVLLGPFLVLSNPNFPRTALRDWFPSAAEPLMPAAAFTTAPAWLVEDMLMDRAPVRVENRKAAAQTALKNPHVRWTPKLLERIPVRDRVTAPFVDLPTVTLEALLEHRVLRVHRSMANKSLPSHVLRTLGISSDQEVKRQLANNPASPLDLLADLQHDEDAVIVASARTTILEVLRTRGADPEALP